MIERILLRELELDRRSLSEIARAVGVSIPTVTRFYNGERSLSLTSAGKLLDFYGYETIKRKGEA